jgi:hypothetical protein
VRRREEQALDAPALASLAPVRRAAWTEKEDGRVVVERPRPRRTGGLGGLFARLSHRMSMPKIRLDAAGSFVWRQLDGSTTVAEACRRVRGEMGEAAEPAEERVGRFVAQLHELELVLLPGVDPPAEVAAAADPRIGPGPAAR